MTGQSSRNISPPLPPDPRPRSQRNSFVTPGQQDDRWHPAASISQQPQPIRDAVSSTFDESVPRDFTSSSPLSDARLEEVLVNRITQAVLDKLTTNGNAGAAPVASVVNGIALSNAKTGSESAVQPSPPLPPIAASRSIGSPTFSSESSVPARYTPPSPCRRRDRHSETVSSPDVIASNRSSVTSGEPTFSGSEFDIDDHMDGDRDDKLDSHNSTVIDDRDDRHDGRWHRIESPTRTTATKSRRQSSIRRRPPMQAAHPDGAPWDDMTTVEKAWQPLFDRDGNPLKRLGHFLRGLSNHLIEDYEPRDSLVVTPAKMLRFFDETRVDDEQYPWQTIFSTISDQSLSKLYQKLLAQHHLVQTANHSAPAVPALTPWGFESFMTCLIQAHPEQEFRRLNKAVQRMPVSSFEDRAFRFPKELTRRMLPAKPNVHAAQRLIASMAHEPQIRLRNADVMPPPPPPQHTVAAPMTDRGRRPLNSRSHSNAIDDEDLIATSRPIERERKPYIAKEGSGKVHDLDLDWEPRESANRYDEALPRPIRRNSDNSSNPRNATTNRNRLSTGPGTAPPLAYNNFPRGSGRRSPPLSSSYSSKSDVGLPDFPQHNVSFRAASDVGLDDRRSSRRQTMSSMGSTAIDIESRGKPIAQRNSAAAGFDPSYGSLPPPLPPVSTSFGSQRSNDEPRRRSAVPSTSESWTTAGASQRSNYDDEYGR